MLLPTRKLQGITGKTHKPYFVLQSSSSPTSYVLLMSYLANTTILSINKMQRIFMGLLCRLLHDWILLKRELFAGN